MTSFSRRHGYSGQAAPITVREDAPEALRHAVVQIAAEEGFGTPSAQRALICRVLRVMPDRSNWSEYPNVAGEVEDLITNCKWFRVYDIAEAFYAEAAASKPGFGAPNGSATGFESKLNEVLYEQGIGWKMERGQIVYRGDQPFEQTVASARHVLQQSNRSTRSRVPWMRQSRRRGATPPRSADTFRRAESRRPRRPSWSRQSALRSSRTS